MLAPNAMLFQITDVPDLYNWMQMHLEKHPLFERVPDEQLSDDDQAALGCVKSETEEGKKVTRNGGGRQWATWRRIPDPTI